MTDTIDHEKFARKALAVLVERVLSSDVEDKRITYGDLAKCIGFPEPHRGSNFAKRIGKTLGKMGDDIANLFVQGEIAPKMQSLVINQGEKVPGSGFENFCPEYKDLPLAEKRNVANEYQEKVYAFGEKWLDVLDQLNISHESSVAVYPDEIDDDSQITEGAKKRVVVNRYERSPVARSKCIEKHGCKCSVCGFDFEREYGEIGKGFIHVHHIVELSKIGAAYKVDPVNDLRPVCPNCHAMLHHMARPARSIDELKDIVAESKSRATRR